MNKNRDYKELCKRISAKVNLLVGHKLTSREFRLKLKDLHCPYYVTVASFISNKYATYGQPYSFDYPIYYMDFYDHIKHFIEVKEYGINEVNKIQHPESRIEESTHLTDDALIGELRKRGYTGSIFIKKEIKL